jgi:type I restriction enzyme S subunit
MSEFKEYRLGEIAQIQNGYAFKSSEFAEKGVPIIKIKNIVPPIVVLDEVQFYNNDITTKLEKFVVKKKDFLISMTGSTVNQMASAVGKMARYGFSKPSLMNQRVAKIYSTSDKVIDDYLFYYLNRFDVQFDLASSASGSANQANISPEQLKSYLVKVPDIETQKGIVEILSSLDDKIELNNKINKELESLAQLLFKRWFMDFEFQNEDGEPYKSSGGEMIESELGEIPKGWEVISLTDIMDFQGGTQPPSTKFTNILSSNSIRLIQIRDYYTSNHLTFIPKSSNYKCCEQKDIMIARYGASVGRILFGLEGAYNVALVKVIPMKKNYTEYLRSYLNSPTFQDRLLSLSGRSAQAGFNKDDFSSFKMPFPKNGKILDIYEEIFNTSIDIFLNNKKEISTLEELRDSLLPKLISGELQINDN